MYQFQVSITRKIISKAALQRCFGFENLERALYKCNLVSDNEALFAFLEKSFKSLLFTKSICIDANNLIHIKFKFTLLGY